MALLILLLTGVMASEKQDLARLCIGKSLIWHSVSISAVDWKLFMKKNSTASLKSVWTFSDLMITCSWCFIFSKDSEDLLAQLGYIFSNLANKDCLLSLRQIESWWISSLTLKSRQKEGSSMLVPYWQRDKESFRIKNHVVYCFTFWQCICKCSVFYIYLTSDPLLYIFGHYLLVHSLVTPWLQFFIIMPLGGFEPATFWVTGSERLATTATTSPQLKVYIRC